MKECTAVVLSAGEGSRLRPLTRNRPKPMLPAATKPILAHVFDQLVAAGITEIVVVVGYRRNRVQSHFGSSFRDVPLSYVTQKNQLGTGHALLAAESQVGDEPILVINGDQIVDSRIISDVLESHRSETVATLALLQRSNIDGYGGVIVEDEEVRDIVESPTDERSYLLNAGVYALGDSIFDVIRAVEPSDGELHLVDALSALIDSGETVHGTVSSGIWVDATYPWDLLDVSFELFDAEMVGQREGADDTGDTMIHESAVIREPVVLDRNCVIGPGAVVGPYVCLGDNATVGSNAVVKRSVIDADTRIEQNATVIECVTGTGVTIGPGSTIPGGPGDVRVEDRVFEGEALGALLADRTEDRGGVTYVPGTLVGPCTNIQAGATVRGTLEEGTEVRY